MTDPAPAPASKSTVFLRRLSSTLGLWAAITAAILTGHPWVFFALVVVFGGLALVEWCRMFGAALSGASRGWIYLCAAAYTAGVAWESLHPARGSGLVDAAGIATVAFGLFALALRHELKGRETLWTILAGIAGFVYVPYFFSFAWKLLVFPGWDGISPLPGTFYLLFVVAVSKFTDTGAYFFGMLLGRHKMIPHISPGKTWEGFVGGIVGAFVAAFALRALAGDRLPLITPLHASVLAVGLALVTVVADLAESVVKRCLGVKDSGRMLPGIGGALDLIDSLLFAAPAGWLYLNWLRTA